MFFNKSGTNNKSFNEQEKDKSNDEIEPCERCGSLEHGPTCNRPD